MRFPGTLVNDSSATSFGRKSVTTRPVAEMSPLSACEASLLLGRDILSSLKGILFKRIRRDKDIVSTDYDLGNWSRVLEQRDWLKRESLEEYVGFNEDATIIAKIDNLIVRVTRREYYDYRKRKLQEILSRFAGDVDTIVELGSGFGMNLFSLSLTRKWKNYFGFDISENGIQAAREAAEYYKLTGMSFDKLDLTQVNDPGYSTLAGRVCFTYLCLEQLKYATPQIVESLLHAKIRRCIHIEPSFELLNLWSPKDLVNYLYVKKNDYQDNLLKTLRRFQSEGRLTITAAERLYYAPTHRNDPTLICWEPRQ